MRGTREARSVRAVHPYAAGTRFDRILRPGLGRTVRPPRPVSQPRRNPVVMLQSFRSLAAAVIGTLALSTVALAGEGWVADYDEAVKIAKAEKKDLFVDFTGSDWCIWCKRLDKEVFAHDEFLSAIKKDFVLVSLDFPNAEEVKAKVPNPKRNAELQEKYGVQGFPTVLLMNADGVVYAQTGYQKGGPAKYIEHVKEIKTKGRAALTEMSGLLDAYAKATGDAKNGAWDKIADSFDKNVEETRAATLLVPTIKEALTFDKDNKAGRKMRAIELLIKHGQADDALFAEARTLDPKNEKGLLERVVEAQFGKVRDDDTAKAALDELDKLVALGPRKDKKLDFMLHLQAASWCDGPLDDKERAKKYAQAAKEIGSDDERMMKALDEILGG